MDIVANPDLVDHKNKCRCCFKPLKSAQKTVEISKSIEKRFLELTKVALIQAEFYSNVICEGCNSKLSEFADFRQEMYENQTSLYQFEPYENSCAPEEVPAEQTLLEEVIEEEPAVFLKVEDENEEEFEVHTYEIIEEPPSMSRKRRSSDVESPPSDSKMPKLAHSSQRGRRKNCHLCGLSVAVNGWYHHVLRAHTNQVRFICDGCGKGFRVKNDLKEHMQVHMTIESRPKFPCAVCGAVLLSRSALKNHEHTFHSDVVEEHPCECGKVFISRMKLNQHRSNVHTKGHFPCPACDRVFTVKAVLQKHITVNHKDKVPCEICDKMHPPGSAMVRHMKTHAPGTHRCSFESCNKIFQTKRSLTEHIENQHSTSDFVICPSCPNTFSSIKNLNRHISRQHSNIRIQCEVEECKHTSSRKDYLTAHYKSHKDIDEETKNALLAKVREIKLISW